MLGKQQNEKDRPTLKFGMVGTRLGETIGNTARHSSGATAGSGVHASNNVYDAGVPAAAKSLKSSQNGAAVGFNHDSSEDSEAEC